MKNSSGQLLVRISEVVGEGTNNEAEYLAVKAAYAYLNQQNTKPSVIHLSLDSQLVYHQLRGTYKVKASHLQKLLSEIKILEKNLHCQVFYHLIPRELNQEADLLVNQALDSTLD